MKLHSKVTVLLTLALGACSSEPPTFLSYTQQKSKAAGTFDPEKIPKRTDALALNYANMVEACFRAKASGARFTREGSDTGLAGLAAVTGAAQTLAIGAGGLSSLGIASGGIVALRTIFDAKGRATAYSEAAQRIHAAIKDYGAYNLNDVSPDYLTPNGWTLVNVVQSNIDIVTKILNGHLPTAQALTQASEAMTEAGATRQRTGATPNNNIPAHSLTGTKTQRIETVMSKLVDTDLSGPTTHRATWINGKLDTGGESKTHTQAPVPGTELTTEELPARLRATLDKKTGKIVYTPVNRAEKVVFDSNGKPTTVTKTAEETNANTTGAAAEKIPAQMHAAIDPLTGRITYSSTDPGKIVVPDEKGKPTLVSKTAAAPPKPKSN